MVESLSLSQFSRQQCSDPDQHICYPKVRDGARVSQDLPDYWDRVQTHSMKIEIRHVNTSDEGRYILKDRRDRVVSITRMDLTGGSPTDF